MITLADIRQTGERIAPYVRRTPLVANATLTHELGVAVFLKQELFQKTGCFKPRGAFNQILAIPPEERHRGVVAVSGGNAAQGVAYASRVLGVRALICMPETTPTNYINATRGYGAEIDFAPNVTEAIARFEAFARQGWHAVHPFDSPYLMMGTGTIGLEILEDLPEVTDVFVSIGGGGLISGITTALKALKPEVRMWGVETAGSDTMGQALKAGHVVHITPRSLAKTLGSPYVAEAALALMQKHLHQHVLVTDREAFDAEVFLLERAKLLTELAASCTLAAARKVKEQFEPDSRVVLLLCGGNASLDNLVEYRRLLAEAG